jgi:hypothetical protein
MDAQYREKIKDFLLAEVAKEEVYARENPTAVQLGRGLGGRVNACREMIDAVGMLDDPALWREIDSRLAAARADALERGQIAY